MTAATYDVTLDQPMPQSPDAERAVLGSCLISPTAFYRVCNIVGAEDFFKDAHRTIFDAINHLSGDQTPIDVMTVKELLVQRGVLDQAGGSAYVSSLLEYPPDVANVERYARFVKRESRKRNLVLLGNSMMRAAMDPGEDPEDIAAAALSTLSRDGHGDAQSESLYEVTMNVAERKSERTRTGIVGALHTTFALLDQYRVVRRKAVTIVAAPSSHGKTTLMKNLAAGILRGGETHRVAFYSLEEDDEEFTETMMAILSGALLKRIQNQTLTEVEQFKVREALGRLGKWHDRFFFADRIRDFESLHADCRRLKAQYGLDAVFVDYLQLMGGFDESTTEREVNRIGRGFKRLAQDLDVAVVAGSQVNKEREKRASRRLFLGDMKHGAVIGEHADVAIMFQRPRQDDTANQEIKWCELVFQIAKNRGRETGDVPMHADMPTQTFAEGDCEDNNCRWRTSGDSQMRM